MQVNCPAIEQFNICSVGTYMHFFVVYHMPTYFNLLASIIQDYNI